MNPTTVMTTNTMNVAEVGEALSLGSVKRATRAVSAVDNKKIAKFKYKESGEPCASSSNSLSSTS